MPQNPPVIAGTRIGHVHLKVADLDRALGFYCGVLGFEVMQRLGSGAAFISAGGYHHHIGLNTWESKGGHPPPPGTTGLFHTAILYPTRPALADALHRVIAGRHSSSTAPATTASARRCICAIPTRTASSSIATGPKEEWPRTPDGSLAMFTKRLDLEDLLRQRESVISLIARRRRVAVSATMLSLARANPCGLLRIRRDGLLRSLAMTAVRARES